MTGEELKKILLENKIVLKELAIKLNTSQPGFSQALGNKEVKTGLLEKICDALNVKLDYFYSGTKYLDSTPGSSVPEDEKKFTDKDEEILYLKGKLSAMKDAYDSLLEKVSTSPSAPFRKAVND